jgi:hypothetical protein
MHVRYHARPYALEHPHLGQRRLGSEAYTKRRGGESKRGAAHSPPAVRAAMPSSTRRPMSWRSSFDGQWISAAAA